MGIFDRALTAVGLVQESEVAQLREANADGKLLSRKVEDLAFGDLYSQDVDELDMTWQERRELIRRAYNYYFNDPIIRRVVDLKVLYALGDGIGRPTYRDDSDDKTDDNDAILGNYIFKLFWDDPENQRVLTSTRAQHQRATEVECAGNLFLSIFTSDSTPTLEEAKNDKAGQGEATLKLATVPEREITQIITHPDHKAIPLFYRREWTERRFDFSQGLWVSGEEHVMYYRDWEHRAPEGFGPDEANIADGVIMHLKPNAVGDMMFGLPALTSVLTWARGLNQFANSRMAVINALAQLAAKVKVKGGGRQVKQQVQRLQELQQIAARIDGGATGVSGTDRRRPDASQTAKVVAENENASLEPAVTDTGSQSAATDGQFLKGQIAAGGGIPLQHLGDSGNSTTAANATSMDAPLLVMCEANQELWRTTVARLAKFVIKEAGLDPDKVLTTAPPIVRRDVAQISTSMLAASQALDPGVGNKKLTRFLFLQILKALGVEDADRVVDETFGDDWEPPVERAKRITIETQAAAAKTQSQLMAQNRLQQDAAGAPPEDPTGAVPPPAPAQLGPGSFTDPSSRTERSQNYANKTAVLAEAASSIAQDIVDGDDDAALNKIAGLIEAGVGV